MGKFSEFGIELEKSASSFDGDKLHMDRILNREIHVHDYKIEKSKFEDKGNGKRLCLSFSIGQSRHIVFTGSTQLMNLIDKVPKDKFPFDTVIIKQNGGFLFT